MKRSQRREHKKEIPVIRYMLYLLVATSIVSGVTLSRYTSSTSGSDTANVAKFEYSIDITDQNSTGTLTFDSLSLNIYATSKLSDAENCMFDDVAVVRQITVTNQSEVAVSLELSMAGMDEDGIVWCVFDGSYADAVTGTIYGTIRTKLGGAAPSDFSALWSALAQANADTTAAWNNGANLGVGESKTFTVVFWAEHEPARDVGGWYDKDVVSSSELSITVSQID